MVKPNKNQEKNDDLETKKMEENGYPLLSDCTMFRDMKSEKNKQKEETCYTCTSFKIRKYETSHDFVNRIFHCSICHWRLVQTSCDYDTLFKEDFS